MQDESQSVVHIKLDLFWASKVKQLKLLVFNILKALGSDLEFFFCAFKINELSIYCIN